MRAVFNFRGIFWFALLSLGVPARVVHAAVAMPPLNVPLISLGELHAGQHGEVWTVFRGTQPEPFSVEVTGVVENAVGPGKSLILCELTDPRVAQMGAVAGMSGSPLYVEGKFAGALSYQIQRFETTHYAGFTPAADLIEVRDQKKVVSLTNGLAPARADSSDRNIPAPDRSLGAYQLLKPAFTVAGLSTNVVGLFEPYFQRLGIAISSLGGSGPGGAAESAATDPLVGGSAIAVALATGDISLAGTGTVCRVDGNRVTAFGHPMIGLGDVDFPMCSANILAILPSTMQSIKVANTGAIIGTFDQDRLTGVAGTLGKMPVMTRVQVDLREKKKPARSWQFSVARHESLTATLISTGVTQAILGSNTVAYTEGFRLSTEVRFNATQKLTTKSLYPGAQGFAQGLNDFVKDLTTDIQNPYEKTFPEQVNFLVEPLDQNPAIVLETFQLSQTEARAGQTISAEIVWRDYQAGEHRESIPLSIPAEWTGRTLEVVLGSGPEIDDLTARPRTIAAAQLRSFDAYLQAVRAERDADTLYLCVTEKSSFFTDQGGATPEMPRSLERIARQSDDSRYHTRQALLGLWETKVLPGKIMTNVARRPLKVIE